MRSRLYASSFVDHCIRTFMLQNQESGAERSVQKSRFRWLCRVESGKLRYEHRQPATLEFWTLDWEMLGFAFWIFDFGL